MTKEAEASANVPSRRHRGDLQGIAYLGITGIVMLAWIAGLIWGLLAFFNWLLA